MKPKAAILISGSGTNLEALMEKEEQGLLNCSIEAVISDKESAYGLVRAKNHHKDAYFVNPRAYPSKKEYEEAIDTVLKEKGVEWIILSGYMRYIGEHLLEAYPDHIVNIHPAYLPEFPGAHGILDAWNAGVSQSGVTVHYVDEGVDTGTIILQERVKREEDMDLDAFEAAIHAKEYDLFYRAVNKAIEDEKAG